MNPKDIAKVITEDPDVFNEGLHGYRTVATGEPIDDLINAVDANWLDFDINNQKFQQLATKVYGENAPRTPEEWLAEITKSNQDEGLKEKLYEKIGIPPGDRRRKLSTVSTSHYKPGIINFKDGRIIKVDHVVVVTTKYGGKFILAGIKPINVHPRITDSLRNSRHPDFWDIGHKLGTNPQDPSHSSWVVRKKFSKIMSINPDNVKNISGTPWQNW